MDGILTAYGVYTLPMGTEAEGNVILKHCMQYIGIVPAIILFKSLGIFITIQVRHLCCSWLPLFFVCGIYTVVDVSWIFILLGIV